LLVRAGDAESLADGVVRVLADAPLRRRLAERGRYFVETERSWRASVARYQGVYEPLLARRGNR
jgi:glycosyltransferase involved in cell wall biosynthesis